MKSGTYVPAMLEGIAGSGFADVKPYDQSDVALIATATDTTTGAAVRVKFLNPKSWARDRLQQTVMRQRLAVEAYCLTVLAGPGVIPLIRTGTVDGEPYLVLAQPEGFCLDTLGRTDPLNDFLARLAQSVGYALAKTIANAHKKGIALCSFGRHNVMLTTSGEVVLCDLSFAEPIDLATVPHLPGLGPEVSAWYNARLLATRKGQLSPVSEDIRLLAELVTRIVVREEFQTTPEKLADAVRQMADLKAAQPMFPVESPALRAKIYNLLNSALVRGLIAPASFANVEALGESFRLAMPVPENPLPAFGAKLLSTK